jgi:ABC-2 type transport system permease protein
MSTLGLALRDSRTMLGRNLRHQKRYPSMTMMVAFLPVVFLLLFVYVFGGTLGNGLPGGPPGGVSGGLSGVGGRGAYLAYVLPGILLLTMTGTATATAVSVASDMSEGIIARFRTMAISRASVLTGHVWGSVIQTMVSLAFVVGVAVLIGFRSGTGPLRWLGAAGLLALVAFAIIWLSVALGLISKSVESASNAPMPLLILPFLGSGFVPTASMPAGLRQFAEYQPFTPIIDTLRALLVGGPVGWSAVVAVAWCAGVAIVGYVWAKRRFNRDPSAR